MDLCLGPVHNLASNWITITNQLTNGMDGGSRYYNSKHKYDASSANASVHISVRGNNCRYFDVGGVHFVPSIPSFAL